MAKRSEQPKRKGPGRPAVHGEPYTRTNVVLFNRQVAWLDHIGADIRGRSGAVVNRAEIIRGVLDAIADAKVDLTSAESEADVRKAVYSRLRLS